jgi:hypothetical protein
MLVCFFTFAREAAGALGTRLSLRPLFSEATENLYSSGVIPPRDRRLMWSNVIASAAKQSILSLRCEMDCFAALYDGLAV